jgi:hypothetical protein
MISSIYGPILLDVPSRAILPVFPRREFYLYSESYLQDEVFKIDQRRRSTPLQEITMTPSWSTHLSSRRRSKARVAEQLTGTRWRSLARGTQTAWQN